MTWISSEGATQPGRVREHPEPARPSVESPDRGGTVLHECRPCRGLIDLEDLISWAHAHGYSVSRLSGLSTDSSGLESEVRAS
jgi:hypothetical protein